MTETVVARSAKLGDSCVRDIPRLFPRKRFATSRSIDSTKFTRAAAA